MKATLIHEADAWLMVNISLIRDFAAQWATPENRLLRLSTVFFLELANTTSGIDNLLLPSIKRMARRTYLYIKILPKG